MKLNNKKLGEASPYKPNNNVIKGKPNTSHNISANKNSDVNLKVKNTKSSFNTNKNEKRINSNKISRSFIDTKDDNYFNQNIEIYNKAKNIDSNSLDKNNLTKNDETTNPNKNLIRKRKHLNDSSNKLPNISSINGKNNYQTSFNKSNINVKQEEKKQNLKNLKPIKIDYLNEKNVEDTSGELESKISKVNEKKKVINLQENKSHLKSNKINYEDYASMYDKDKGGTKNNKSESKDIIKNYIDDSTLASTIENIKVCIRIRPLNLKNNKEKGEVNKCVKVQDNKTLILQRQ